MERKRQRMLKLTFDKKQEREKQRESQRGSTKEEVIVIARKQMLKAEIEQGKEKLRESPLLSTYQ